MPIKGSRGEACLVTKCALCGRENSLGTWSVVLCVCVSIIIMSVLCVCL